MQNLNVSYIQSHLFWEDKAKNLEFFSAQISRLYNKTDLIVLPEMFPTGFSMSPEKLFETADGNVFQWMKEQSWRSGAVVAGSLIVKEGDNYYNRFLFVFPDGNSQFYDKRHLFRMAGEHETYAAGTENVIVEIKGWRIRPLVCYDLRFPVWARNTDNYDTIVYVANWPAKRRHHWDTLLRARAIENQAFAIGVNRIGTDGNKFEYSGDSAVYSPLGDLLSSENANKETTETIELDYALLKKWREGFPVNLDADNFTIS